MNQNRIGYRIGCGLAVLAAGGAVATAEQAATGEGFSAQFAALREAGETGKLEALLERASTEEADNPDYYALASNYWWGAAQDVALQPLPEGDFELDVGDLSITDPKTGKRVGRIGKAGDFDRSLQERAVALLNEGTRRFPERADLALGLAHIQRELKSHDGVAAALSPLLATAKRSPDKLRWTRGGALPEPAATFIPESVHSYNVSLFNANSPETDALCTKLLDAVIDSFPNHPYAYNLKAALADANGKPDEALKMLETAHQKAPDDPLILGNLASAYVDAGQRERAKECYAALLKLDLAAGARARVEAELRKLGDEGAEE